MAKKPMGISGLLPTAKPQAAMPRQTKGLGATRANLTNARKDSLPRMKGKKAC